MSDYRSERRPLIVANWKMNKTGADTQAFLKDFLARMPSSLNRDVVVCPPFTSLETAAALLRDYKGAAVGLGAQNLNDNKAGAFTGEISAAMLSAVGCSFVIIGHSERRQYYGETNALINKKIKASFENQLLPIVCVGETLHEREANQTFEVISRQLQGALDQLPSAQMRQVVIAYEPVWAIGTGRVATPEQAQAVHLFIRDRLKDQYGSSTSLAVRILYGGSVKPDNMAVLMACEDIDGGLVGGASLEAGSFFDLVSYQSAASV